KHTVRELIVELVEAKISVAGEYSSNMIASYKEIIEEAKAYANDLDIAWDDEIIPEHVQEVIDADREFWSDLQ
ncbi:MAG TPA: hypothetical protein VNS88_01760, partial [Nitrospiraceae bacterium]|nr:hypothetical protein [Nitrospiraceae bacterium]